MHMRLTERFAKGLTGALFVLLVLFCLLTYRQHGISNDEEVQHIYGRLLLDFYGSFGADKSAFQYKNLYLYGGFFDVIAAAIERFGGMASPWETRHLLCAVFGLYGMWGVYSLAKLAGNAWVGFWAVLFLCVTGAWSGTLFTHTKDVPFAAFMTWALYYSARVLEDFPNLRLPMVLRLGAVVGCAFGLRVGALFAVFYFGLGLVFCAWMSPNRVQSFRIALLKALPGALPIFLLTAVFWPWVVQSPGNLLEAITSFSHFAFELHTLLNGQDLLISDLPGDYLSLYLAVKLPELVILGMVFAVSLACLNMRRCAYGQVAILARVLTSLAFFFPVVYTLQAAPPLYNGLRHFTFVLPPACVLAALGWWAVWRACAHRQGVRCALGAGAAVLFMMVAIPLYRLHPYTYAYFNQFAGGTRALGSGQWETDYWSSSLLEGSLALNAFIQKEAVPPKPWLVAVCAEAQQVSPYLDARYFVISKDWYNADFFLSGTHMSCDKAMQGKEIAMVTRADMTLAVVKDRRALVTVQERTPR